MLAAIEMYVLALMIELRGNRTEYISKNTSYRPGLIYPLYLSGDAQLIVVNNAHNPNHSLVQS